MNANDEHAPGCLCERLAPPGAELSPVCLGHLWVFADLGPEESRALAANARRKPYERGQAIFRQGEAARQMFLLKAGRVKLSKITDDGGEVTLDIRGAGDFLGENMLHDDGGDFPVTATCLEPTLTCGFTKEGFEKLVLEHPAIGLGVIRNLSRRIDWLSSRVETQAMTNLEERLYRVLVQVAREHGRPGRQGLELAMPLTHEDLSFLVGAHRVSITRAMKELRQAGRVISQGRTLILPQAA